jgi:two-component system response regulator FixJ
MGHTLTSWDEGYQERKLAREVFVVDDDENTRDLLEGTLAAEGFAVTSFVDGDSFLVAAGTRFPICVFLDVVMPRRSGLEVLKELRARRYETPVILMSARDDTPTIVEAIKNGAHDYIRKPFERYAPVVRVHDAIEAWSCREQIANALTVQPGEADEWFRLSPSERDTLSLMRLVSVVCK